MPRGRVYEWHPDAASAYGGSVRLVERELCHLSTGGPRELRGRFAEIVNRGVINVPDHSTGQPIAAPLGPAQPDGSTNFCFEPGRGGGRLDKIDLADEGMRYRYVQAMRFGEVNSYFHVDRIATYIDALLAECALSPLPRVTVAVCAHHGAVDVDGRRDGVRRAGRIVPFEGGHYRLPARRFDVPEWAPLAASGEIHVGPGRNLLRQGALIEAVGGPYRANAAHNGAILYHEYGHHVTRHTADFQANALRDPERQKNVKSPLDEGTADYWAATMLNSPHIWGWHRHHAHGSHHPRSLASSKTMTDFDCRPNADPHTNGTIWGAALWDLREHLGKVDGQGTRLADSLVLQALAVLGSEPSTVSRREVRSAPGSYTLGLDALLSAAEILRATRHSDGIRAVLGRRGINASRPHMGNGARS